MEIDTICLSCHSLFPSPDVLVHHLNTGGTSCISILEDSFEIPTPPAFICGTGETNIAGQYHEHSEYIYGKGETLLDHLKMHEHERCQEHQMYYPFPNEGEWELAKFLVLNLTKAQISQFLKL